MVGALSPGATDALVGALAGGFIAIGAQAIFGSIGAFRGRRVAAQVIYAELLGNYANALVAIGGAGWSSTKPSALRAGWETYGARLLLPWHKAHDLGSISSAYNRVDDIAWLATEGAVTPQQNYAQHVLDMQVGLYVVGRAGGYSDIELSARQLDLPRIQATLGEGRRRARESRAAHRRERWARPWRRLRSLVRR